MRARSKATTVVLWICQLMAAAAFGAAGSAKLAGAAPMVQMFDTIGFGQWFRYATGAIEVAGALCLLVPSFAAVGAALLVCTMLGAIVAHVTVLQSSPSGPLVLLALCAAVLWLRRSAVPTSSPIVNQ